LTIKARYFYLFFSRTFIHVLHGYKSIQKAKIPIDLATLRDFLFYLLFNLAISFPIVFFKYTLVFVLVQDIY